MPDFDLPKVFVQPADGEATPLFNSKGSTKKRIQFEGADDKTLAIAGEIIQGTNLKEGSSFFGGTRTIKVLLVDKNKPGAQPTIGYVKVNINSMKKRLGTDVPTKEKIDQIAKYRAEINALALANENNAPKIRDVIKVLAGYRKTLDLIKNPPFKEIGFEKNLIKTLINNIYEFSFRMSKILSDNITSGRLVSTDKLCQDFGLLVHDLEDHLVKLPAEAQALDPKFNENLKALTEIKNKFKYASSGLDYRKRFDGDREKFFDAFTASETSQKGMLDRHTIHKDLLRTDQQELLDLWEKEIQANPRPSDERG